MAELVMICSVCRRTLDLRMDDEGAHYQHTFQDSVNEDHEPVPMAADENWQIRCDFCNVDTATYRLPARDFRMPILGDQHSRGGWAACNDCARLIEINQWSALERRIATMAEERGQPMHADTRTALRALYRVLRKNITGPLEEI